MLSWYSKLPIVLLASIAWIVDHQAAYAQITPDQTLGVEQSKFTPQEFRDLIEGGAIRGSNLFHSFLEFNVNEGQNVYFANPNGIANIITRVTGSNISQIFGTLGVEGTANLYLINPNGINFGNNARLDIRGSFIATTADGIRLGEQGLFSATEPETSDLLTIQPGAFFTNALRQHQAQIRNQGNLAVGGGQRLILSADTITSTGSLTAQAGTVEVSGSLISLLDNTEINVSGPNGGGSIIIGNQQTSRTFIGPNVEIRANAIAQGNGGRVIISGNEITGFYGNIRARGGEISGNGGYVEISGQEYLTFRGNVDTSAINGFAGTLLLDSTDIIIANGPEQDAIDEINSEIINNSDTADAILTTPLSQLEDVAATTIYETLMEDLSETNNFVLQATNDIVINDLEDNSLNLTPGSELMVFTADADRDGVGDFRMEDTSFDTIRTHGRNIAITGANITVGNIDTSIPPVGDTGELLETATVISDSPGVPFEFIFISGAISEESDVDLYQIFLTGGGTFSARTTEGTELDTQLFLFDEEGIGIYANDDDADCGGCAQSFLPAGTPLTPTEPGIYYLAISGFGVEPVSEAGDIFPDGDDTGDFTSIDEADELGSESPLVGWEDRSGFDIGEYNIILTGVEAPFSTFTEFNESAQIADSGSISLNATNGTIRTNDLKTISTSGEGGSISLQATEDIVFDESLVRTYGVRGGGDITLTSRNLSMNDADILAVAARTGNAGDVTITVTDTVDVSQSVLSTGVIPEATGNGGDLTIDTQRLIIRDGSQVGSGTLGDGDGGTVTIRATEVDVVGIGEVELLIETSNNNSSFSGLFTDVLPRATGNGGTIFIDTERLRVREGASINTSTSGEGDGGFISIQAKEIEVIGTSPDGQFRSNLIAGVNRRATGNGGNLTIETEGLTVVDGAELRASTSGQGNAGNVEIYATERVTLSGFSPDLGSSSAISANTESNATGIGGEIFIQTPTLGLDNGAVITAISQTDASAGQISLDVDTLALIDGAQIFTSSFKGGDAGNITINASEKITLSGIDPTYNERLARVGRNSVDPDGPASAIASRATQTGKAGSLNLNTKTFSASGRALVTVSSTGTGVAGTLNISADTIQLDNGFLNAKTSAGDQGNITLSNAKLIFLRNNSGITTNARDTATGGNITITTDFLVTSKGSNISANAILGRGGNINITAIGIFSDRSSKITASSQLGIDGSVTLNTPEVNPAQALDKLPVDVVDTSNQIITDCAASSGNSFLVTGKGGIPANPAGVLRGQVVVPDLRLMVDQGTTQLSNRTISNRRRSRSWRKRTLGYNRPDQEQPITKKKSPIIEAQGWIINQQGIVELVPYPAQGNYSSWNSSFNYRCFRQ
ncbi:MULTISPECIES: filamentous hemagglutinin N-terminal domain-containing protein [unclassified Moorena]|uniref:two-partner secretion domain-containing protein n=1 Tax=unclassified Moorena TaxID=2683338 RepID=UPI0013FFB468|nr:MULTISPECIES: filamentous hemagglutinin N-terminal domain-containing protein [unclassified Moorena]NEO11982.1 filamentous hemagglutinin N-terminal domain-containing protein [Moorena sp. SIO3E8]NEQ03522.1 filamentous hemagglutinin N-terminal domain-containing protein [Moorena sp. SIO3F7]